MPPIDFPTVAPRATPPVTPAVEGHLAILRRLMLRAKSKGGVLTQHEVLMGASPFRRWRGCGMGSMRNR
jgi:hypothetical protein